MSIEVGEKVNGKVSGITNFGAFVDLGDKKTGLVHISEVSNNFVKDIHDVLTVGDKVTVKVLSVGEDGKISLSIRKASDNVQKDFGKIPKKSATNVKATSGTMVREMITKITVMRVRVVPLHLAKLKTKRKTSTLYWLVS